jgi:predicted acylesterase/phospholipase RssA
VSRRLAITISGAVSLGSYEAGVLYEVLDAIGQHNQNPQTADAEKVYIDVLTGASAGGMSVAVAAQKLLYDADALSNPYQNALYQAWVQDIDIDTLLTLQKDERPDCSIFSSDLIESLSNRYLCSRYSNGPAPLQHPHPAVAPGGFLRLGLALSNLNGLDYGRKTLSGDEFIYSRFEDEYRRTFTRNDDNSVAWHPVAQAAAACGAFPFAFRPQDLQRSRREFTDDDLVTDNLGPDPLSFTYTDGGVFQNEPLGLAKSFVDEIDNHLNSDSRAFLFITPDPKVSTADRQFTANLGNFRTMLGRLVSAIFYQSRFQDWIRAEKVNEEVGLFNTRATQIHTLVKTGALRARLIGPVSAVLLKQFFPVDADLEAARAQLRNQFDAEYAELLNTADIGEENAKAWIDAILVLETAAGLHEKDEMYIYTVAAKAEELAGAQLLAFLGFLDQDYRQHDYDVGRAKAQELLTNGAARQKGPLPVLRYTPQPIRPIDSKLAGTKITDAPLEKRKALRDRLKNRADIILKEANLPIILREPLELFYVNAKIREFLGL